MRLRKAPLCSVLVALIGACANTVAPLNDAGARSLPCTEDQACDDARFCTGTELCRPSDPRADPLGCVAGVPPCGARACDETAHRCDACADLDGDGARDADCGGTDCDDADPERVPGNIEVCDVARHDEDCDDATFGFRDADGDEYPDAACCNVAASGAPRCGNDCIDTMPSVHPTQDESCNRIDDDCDGASDEGVTTTYSADADGDGFGDENAGAERREACGAPTGFGLPTDCDDRNATIRPTAPERCDAAAVDEDCDGTANPPALCECVTGTTRACARLAGACSGGNEECINGVWGACSVLPTPEVCNRTDDDCDGTVDEGTTIVCFADGDRDGVAPAGAAVSAACGGCPVGTTTIDPSERADCDDTEATVYEGAPEICDGRDSDCDGTSATDEDADGDRHAPLGTTACAGGYPADDCAPEEPRAYPGQIAYFGAGYCRPGWVSCFGGSRCCMREIALAPDVFDFDCDGQMTVEPSAACAIGCFPASCGSPGPSIDPDAPPPCGTPVSYFTSCGECGKCTSTRVTTTRGLACR